MYISQSGQFSTFVIGIVGGKIINANVLASEKEVKKLVEQSARNNESLQTTLRLNRVDYVPVNEREVTVCL